jgi:hypothetical protein
MSEECEHVWVDARLTSGQGIRHCLNCPRWRLSATTFVVRRRDPEDTRRSMEETSRALGDHRDV